MSIATGVFTEIGARTSQHSPSTAAVSGDWQKMFRHVYLSDVGVDVKVMSTMKAAEADVTEREQQALALIAENDGIHQSDFWKALNVTSRTGSRIINKLLEKDLVEREETVYEERKTYYITVVREAKDLDFSLLMAGDSLSPFIGNNDIDPESEEFSQWIMQLAYND